MLMSTVEVSEMGDARQGHSRLPERATSQPIQHQMAHSIRMFVDLVVGLQYGTFNKVVSYRIVS